jgi:hypothetical protein
VFTSLQRFGSFCRPVDSSSVHPTLDDVVQQLHKRPRPQQQKKCKKCKDMSGYIRMLGCNHAPLQHLVMHEGNLGRALRPMVITTLQCKAWGGGVRGSPDWRRTCRLELYMMVTGRATESIPLLSAVPAMPCAHTPTASRYTGLAPHLNCLDSPSSHHKSAALDQLHALRRDCIGPGAQHLKTAGCGLANQLTADLLNQPAMRHCRQQLRVSVTLFT